MTVTGVIVLVECDGIKMVKVADSLESEAGKLFRIDEPDGHLIYTALQKDLEQGPIICKTVAETENVLKQVKDFYDSQSIDVATDFADQQLFAGFGVGVASVFDVVQMVQDLPPFVGVKFHEQLNQPPRSYRRK